jgi:hypothetical protein
VERRRLCVYFLYLARRLCKSVETLAVTGNTNSGRVVWRQRVLISRLHRFLLSGSRWDIRWLRGRGKTPTLCVFPVLSASVMEKCCDACGVGEYYFRSSCLSSWSAVISVASIVFDRQSMGHTVAERSWKDADFVCIPCRRRCGYGRVL